MSDRGTDSTTERRKAGPQTVGKVGVERWIENVFFGLAEVAILGLPGSIALLSAPYNASVKFAALVGISTLSLAIGTVRTELTALDWPKMSPESFLVRIVYHSAAIVVVAGVGAAVDVGVGSALGSFVVAIALAVGAVWLFPRVVATLRERFPLWDWGRPPR